jgi:hypothetical protein
MIKKTEETIKIAFEFGIILSETAKGYNIEMTPEISKEAEEILLKELKMNGTEKTALNFVPLVMAVLGDKV